MQPLCVALNDEFDLRALRAFASVAEQGSLTRAATTLEVAQSQLSRRIAALESELGGRLFHRTGRGTQPTELAAALLPRVRAMLADADALRAEARGESQSPAGTVDLALVPAVARPLTSLLSARLRREFPRIRLRVREAYSGQVEEYLAAGRADIGLFNRYGRGNVRGAELFLQSGIVLVAARGTAGVHGREIAFRALGGVALVLPMRPNSLVSMVSDLAARHQVQLDIALEAGSPVLIHDAVVHAGLATLVPAHLAEREYAGDGFVRARLVKPAIQQRTWLALTTQRPAGVAARTVARLVRELGTQMAH